MLYLELYQKASFKSVGYLIIACILIFVASHLLFQNHKLDVILLLGMVAIVLIMNFLEKKQVPVGNAVFANNLIQLSTKNENLEFNLNSPVFITIHYGGFRDKIMVGDVIPRYNKYSGTDNLIIIKIDGFLYEFNFLIEDISQEELLLDVVGSWKLQGFNIQFNE